MQWHWGNIGSFLAGLSTVGIAVAALKQGPAAVRAWIEGKTANAAKDLEEAQTIRMERRSRIEGWSAHGVNTYQVVLVDDPSEIDIARDQLAGGEPTAYVVLRVTGAGVGGNANRAQSLRQLIETDRHIARRPNLGEVEALQAGVETLNAARILQ